jgi:hypothetical protein
MVGQERLYLAQALQLTEAQVNLVKARLKTNLRPKFKFLPTCAVRTTLNFLVIHLEDNMLTAVDIGLHKILME